MPTQMAANPADGKLYVVDRNQHKLFVLDTASDLIIGSVAVGAIPENVIVSPDGTKIYVCSSANDEVTVIDAAALTVDATISLNGDDADPFGMAIASGKLYVVGTWTNKVYVIDIDSLSATVNTLINTIPVGAGARDAIARPDGAYVYVSHDTPDGKVTILNTATDTVHSSITIRNTGEVDNKNPRGMAVSGNILYVVNWGDSTVAMINTQSNTKLNLSSPIISGGNGPENLAVTPDGNKLYVVHSSAGSVEILGY